MAPLLPSQQKQSNPQIMRRSNVKKIARISVVLAAVLCAASAAMAFYIGIMLGSSASSHSSQAIPEHVSKAGTTFTESEVQERIAQAVSRAMAEAELKCQPSQVAPQKQQSQATNSGMRFPDGMSSIMVGAAHVDRDAFAAKFNLGVPLDKSDPRNNRVPIFYSHPGSIPTSISQDAVSLTTMPDLSPENATARCDYLHVILQDHGSRKQCVAIMGQYEAFHIQKLMRLPEEGKLDSRVPLRVVNRGAQSSGRKSTKPPDIETTKSYWKTLETYLGHLDDMLEILKPMVEKIAKKNTVIVMVCNFGQSELLLNFLCLSHQRGFDTSSILVFATDQETYDLVHAMGGVTVYYDATLFGEMPVRAAGRYGDKVFTLMMMAKVCGICGGKRFRSIAKLSLTSSIHNCLSQIYCVQLVSLLGYDVLFQDVDVVWFKDPLEYFHDETTEDANFDVYFQDDGNHALYYAPYSANTGFYYVRNNARTQYFFNSFLMAGDLVQQTRSHQIPLVALLQEHSSMYGLRVKIFSRDGEIFPGGHAYHRRKTFMKDLFEGKVHPYIFHMSWTNSKVNKQKFFQQMNEWFLQDKCRGKKPAELWGEQPPADLSAECCSAEPIYKCHYRDKPSKKPCRDSPTIDAGGRSFW